jgi:hypothetical protein
MFNKKEINVENYVSAIEIIQLLKNKWNKIYKNTILEYKIVTAVKKFKE